MKIKTSEWLGLQYSSRKSTLRFKVFNDMYDATTTSGGRQLDADILAQRREVVYRLNTDAKEWDHYLFTEKAAKLAQAIEIDRAHFNWHLLRQVYERSRRLKDACYLSGPREFFRWFSFDGGMAIMHLYTEPDGQVRRHTYSLGFDNSDSPGLDETRSDVWPSALRFLKLLVFTELTEVDILMVESGNKSANTKAPESQRVTNQTEVPLIRVHAHWNTFYINTSIIDVRGFTRQQAYGKGRLLRKEVLIAPHTRNGYKREEKH